MHFNYQGKLIPAKLVTHFDQFASKYSPTKMSFDKSRIKHKHWLIVEAYKVRNSKITYEAREQV